MGTDLGGVATFGDGVRGGCVDTDPSPTYEVLCGTNCTAGIDTNCDGIANDSRIQIAKQAVRNMVLAFGDVDWSLSRFAQSSGSDLNCDRIQDQECNAAGPFISSMGNPQCNTFRVVPNGIDCIWNWPPLWPAACRPGTTAPTMFTWRPGSPDVCINYRGACTVGGNGGDILVGFPDMGAYSGMDNTYGMLSWLDGAETNFRTPRTSGNFCQVASGVGDCELRATGPTPLAGLLNSLGSYMMPIRAADLAAACRPYSVILLTDGAQSTGCTPNNPVTAASTLNAAGILTYVVGFATGAADATQLNAIATAGGTDAGAPGGDTAFFATNQIELAAGLSDIVRRSLLTEICNGADDDCDTLIDEGVTNACGGCGAVPAETCNGADDDCDGTTDEGVSNACGGCGPAPVEVCNRLDDDCDGIIDEDGSGGDICAGCTPTAEICDGVDNDCDGTTDEGVTRACGSDVGTCTAGLETCVVGGGGTFGSCVGAVGPSTEICDGFDNDCDGAIDGFSRPCGTGVGACVPGNQVCIAGSFGSCVGAVGPSAELCDGIDNDCDTRTDESIPGGGPCGTSIGICSPGSLMCMGGALTCVGGTGPDPSETCNSLDDDCDGSTDEGIPTMGPCGSGVGECSPGASTCVGGSFTCVGATGPSAETCNARDDDCDGSTDESNPGGGAACGSSVGVCMAGTTSCVGGSLSCVGATGPGSETCNTLDDDCDGLVDEGNPGGGAACGATDVGACDFGAEACVTGSIMCIGVTGPTPELCDGVDNDCDGSIDEGDPEGGGACGDDTGECMAGTFACVGGSLTCMGGVGPTAEICDGLDNDCDGVIDDGIPVGAPCGTDVGECVPGRNVCRSGAIVCEGGIPPETETCDNLDNDCDATIDEGLGLGVACGTAEGLCMPGTERCISGRLVCEGEVGPTREGCDCEDNDCDGTVDEAPMTGTLCPAGASCVDCQCALPCMVSEFGSVCPTGRFPREDSGMCFCVAERCDPVACATETQERDGSTLCAPDDPTLSTCVCKNNICTFPCDGVVCMDGTVCDPRDPLGRCVENNCRGLGCAAGEICDIMTGDCAVDPCEGVTCGADEACRAGTCEDTCSGVDCPDGEECHAGACETDVCFGRVCAAAEACDPSTGDCIDDLCRTILCARGQVCETSSGNCVADPCNELRCPAGTMCEDGECVEARMMGVDAGTDAGVDASTVDTRDRVLAHGGCGSCVVGAEPARRDSAPWFLVLGLLGLVVYRRRRKGRGAKRALPFALALGVAATVALSSGCDVDPFCLDCDDGPGDAGDAGVDAGPPEAGIDAGTDGGFDAGVDACVEEACNGIDDDCDGTTDEDFDLNNDTENCGGCGDLCAPIGAFPACNSGVCEIDSCDVGRIDLDGDPSNGCEYRCLVETPDDAVCDLRDNDCDGDVDEDIDTDTDALNCGSCGVVCTFPHAGASCVGGACVIGACDADFFDLDTNPANGCEYACTATVPPDETCNLADDDCDGMIDEGDPGGGATCGSSTGACVPGVEACIGGSIQCMGATLPSTETCEGSDEDCDGSVDEGNPDGGRVCGTSTGTCIAGRETCTGGSLVCMGDVGPGTEVCDGLDNNCDGSTDEGNPGGGGSCGTSTGACVAGTESCTGGVIVCSGATGPVAESCNGVDDNCDGSVDEGNPGGGALCGSDIGTCSTGTMTCSGGSLSCVGATGPRAGGELCNSLDDDCDSSIDEGNPGGGGACGITTGACTAGIESCLGGSQQCMGGTGPVIEACNSIDDDCDGSTDENFDFMNDRNNCGGCGTVCSFPDAVAGCSSGSCVIIACDPGFVDVDGMPGTGCEYMCSFAGAEICNGLDDDCDGMTDGVTPPSSFCNPNGVCMGTTPTCMGVSGWVCTFGGTYEPVEVSCDGLDNDCDGSVDEPFPSLGSPCANGTGSCRRTGSVVCLGDGSGTFCTAPPAGSPMAELCNDMDDDCDGIIDEALGLSAIPTVNIGGVRVMQYEASRPDATAGDGGNVETHACSNPNVLPWTNVTWPDARDACCALNPGGSCSPTGWRLCDSSDWQTACEASSGTCEWSYMSSCSTSAMLTCNGEEFDSDAGMLGDQDALFPTGSVTFGTCLADWGGAGVIYDLSGNVKEWTNTSPVAGVHEIRGGAFNNVEPGRTCSFDFTVGDNSFAFPNTGFRCCFY